MERIQVKRLTIAMIAQVVFCLAFAPVIFAEQTREQQSKQRDDAPRGEAALQAARDAANCRPEDSSSAEQRTGRRRGTAGKRSCVAGNRADSLVNADSAWRESTTGAHAQKFGPPAALYSPDLSEGESAWSPLPDFVGHAQFESARPLALIGSSLQPTGPPSNSF
jgi:hypothetical protein